MRLMPFMGHGGGLEVPPLKSISHIFDKFKVILFLVAQFSIFFTSSIEESCMARAYKHVFQLYSRHFQKPSPQ